LGAIRTHIRSGTRTRGGDRRRPVLRRRLPGRGLAQLRVHLGGGAPAGLRLARRLPVGPQAGSRLGDRRRPRVGRTRHAGALSAQHGQRSGGRGEQHAAAQAPHADAGGRSRRPGPRRCS
jgi:hypothetical protein